MSLFGNSERTCVSCRHYYEQWMTGVHGERKIETTRCKIKVRSPVHGQRGDPECHWSRAFWRYCGPHARWWEAKDEEPYRA